MKTIDDLTEEFIEQMNKVDKHNFFGLTREYWNKKWCGYYTEARKKPFEHRIDFEAYLTANRKLESLYNCHKNMNPSNQQYLRLENDNYC